MAKLLDKETRAEGVRKWFKDAFGPTSVWKTIADLDDDAILDLADSFREGVPFATPVFDGAANTTYAICSNSPSCRKPGKSLSTTE